MFLKKITLENVRSIAEMELSFDPVAGAAGTPSDLPRKWTLLLGENGCGKSTVLRAIALVLAGSEALPELFVDPAIWIRNRAKHARVAADLVTKDGQARHVSLEIRAGDGIKEIFEKNAASLAELDAALKHSPRNYFLSGYGASRRLPGGGSSGESVGSLNDSFRRNTRAQNVATLFQGDAALRSMETWAMDLDYRRGKQGVNLVAETFRGLLPEVKFKRIDRQRRRLLFDTPDGVVPLQQLSDGYQNVAAWCGDLLYRVTETFQDYTKPLEARGVLLIDEIDLHLHPVWQRLLVDFLSAKLPNFQIVATTHSPLTAQQAGVGELFMLRRSGEAKAHGATQLFQYQGSPRRLRVDQLLVSPIFGLTTAASTKVESLREQYDHLKRKLKRTPEEKQEFTRLSRTLTELPVARAETSRERQRLALLRDIQKELGGNKSPVAADPSVSEQIASEMKPL